MKSLVRLLSEEKSLRRILILAAFVRLVFVFWGGPFYYGQANYFIQGDSTTWFQAFINLLEKGTFTVNPAVEAGKFFRPPGYSFLFGFFYLITFKNYVLAWKLLVGAQVLMDIASVYFIASIARNILKNSSVNTRTLFSNLSGLIYALYPFAIVFAPILQAEAPANFFLLLSLHFVFLPAVPRNAVLSGIFAGIATLTRLQCAFCLPFMAVAFFLSDENGKKKVRRAGLFCLAIAFTYGLWPLRNALLQHRVVFSQDIHLGGHWSEDFISFLDYSHSISTDHTPYYWSILKNEKVNWPEIAYTEPADSALLDSVVTLCRTCSPGFAHWRFGEKLSTSLVIPSPSCETEIATIFQTLTEKQKQKNPFHYWIVIPFQNLEKCFFKSMLYGNKPLAVKIFSTLLFALRSLLVLAGLLGIYLGLRHNLLRKSFAVIAGGFMITWYLFISFVHRNIEIRYLLQTDILLLIPAAFTLYFFIFQKYQPANGSQTIS